MLSPARSRRRRPAQTAPHWRSAVRTPDPVCATSGRCAAIVVRCAAAPGASGPHSCPTGMVRSGNISTRSSFPLCVPISTATSGCQPNRAGPAQGPGPTCAAMRGITPVRSATALSQATSRRLPGRCSRSTPRRSPWPGSCTGTKRIATASTRGSIDTPRQAGGPSSTMKSALSALMDDPQLEESMDRSTMPFDGRRMFRGGFESLSGSLPVTEVCPV